jgi:hypothetical protein
MTSQTNELFAAALGITAPWFVERVDFNTGQRQLISLEARWDDDSDRGRPRLDILPSRK